MNKPHKIVTHHYYPPRKNYDFTEVDELIRKDHEAIQAEYDISEKMPTVELYTVPRSIFTPSPARRFATDWNVGCRERRYRVYSIIKGVGDAYFETMILPFTRDFASEPSHPPVETFPQYSEDLHEHKALLKRWIRMTIKRNPNTEFEW
jgi:hypothetical protein